MTSISDNTLYDDADLAQFYDLDNRWDADFDYCTALADGANSVLDLGCGTGELIASLSKGRAVTGVDPAAAMLDVARQRPGGEQVHWVQADARSVRLGTQFDLVLLTGHAFQVFLDTGDQKAVLSTIAAHLKPTGRFIFDTRNPQSPGSKENSREDSFKQHMHPAKGAIESWNSSTYDGERMILTYKNSYRVVATDQTYEASAKIRYTPIDVLALLLGDAGLRAENWIGDWQGNAFHSQSPEIIPVGCLL